MKSTEITISKGHISLKGNLVVPAWPSALVIFSHGSGSSRFSPRNRSVAGALNESGMATLLTDLLTEEEDRHAQNRFDIDLLTTRLILVTDHVRHLPDLRQLSVGYFGASTGAASALKAAAHFGKHISAVVSRGGRPDLAGASLPLVTAPTLLVVGSLDNEVITLNREACAQLRCKKDLQLIPGATHLFEEPGKLSQVATLATNWFRKYFSSHPLTR